jgi:hypothetical protein
MENMNHKPLKSGSWLLVACLSVLFIAGLAAAAPPEPLALRSGVMGGPGSDAGLPERLRLQDEDLALGGPALLRFELPLDQVMRERLRIAGISLEGYLGRNGYIAYLPEEGLSRARAVPGLAWAAPYHPGLRIAPAISAVRRDDSRSSIPLLLLTYQGVDAQAVADRLQKLGLTVGGVAQGRPSAPGRTARPGRIVVDTSAAELVEWRESFASWPEILWIDRRPVFGMFNDGSAWVGQSGLDSGLATPVHDNGIYGEGEIVGFLDTGIDADMCFFRDDAHGLPPANVGLGAGSPDLLQRKVIVVNFLWSADNPADPSDWDSHDHGTHVAGSIAGDNPLSPGSRDLADGMAPAAKLVAQDGGYGTDNCADMPAIGCPAADLYPFFEQAYLQGARIHSNSYGDRENYTPYNIYSDASEAADAFMWDHPEFLLVFAAGNNGPGSTTVASPATAKNVLAVGATEHGSAAGGLASFSSQGPTHDGRIKPDVTTPGYNIISADNDNDVTTNNCGTRSMSGTSMACPTAAGLAALVREYFVKGYYPTGAATAMNSMVPSGALLKATLIASARPMEEEFIPPPADPQGWGRILLDDALFFPQDSKRLFVIDSADRFASPADPVDSYPLEIVNPEEPLRVVLAWTDYPSTPAAATNLVNDLDLEIESPSSTIYLGNVFTAGVSQTGGSADTVNNVEAARIETPEIGTWTVRVKPSAIPEPAQGYALVVTGGMPVSGVFLERTALTPDDSAGGNGDGIMDPGEWIDLPLNLHNSGDSPASNVQVHLESLSAGVLVDRTTTSLPDIAAGAERASSAPHLRVHIGADFSCVAPLTLRFTYSAEGFLQSEDVTLESGHRQTLLYDDFETNTGWSHSASESSASTGDWMRGDPDGTDYQPEDDATSAPGTDCLFTALNAGGIGSYDVDAGVVVARSGSYNIAGHPETRLRISRWFGNKAYAGDSGDYFRLEIRESPSADDVLLEELDYQVDAPYWTAVEFRIADFITPGSAVELKVSAADGTAIGNIIEAAIDEVIFWEPVCEIYNPSPNPIGTLTIAHNAADVLLSWERPEPDPLHGEADRYKVYSSATAAAGYAMLQEIYDASSSAGYTDPGVAAGAGILFYQVIAANDAGDAELAP